MLENFVKNLRRLEFAAQILRDGCHDPLESLIDPAMRGDLFAVGIETDLHAE